MMTWNMFLCQKDRQHSKNYEDMAFQPVWEENGQTEKLREFYGLNLRRENFQMIQEAFHGYKPCPAKMVPCDGGQLPDVGRQTNQKTTELFVLLLLFTVVINYT